MADWVSQVHHERVEIGPHLLRLVLDGPEGFASTGVPDTTPTLVAATASRTGSDFGGIAVYLTSDASNYHTGDTFVIDGGMFAGGIARRA